MKHIPAIKCPFKVGDRVKTPLGLGTVSTEPTYEQIGVGYNWISHGMKQSWLTVGVDLDILPPHFTSNPLYFYPHDKLRKTKKGITND